ncbi:MAG: hypothetical protein FJZ16_04755 [Candidatus Omnitrophica bacterium]|nr:hypothetical protein [Candidatus Omnitrophota bacterium]
MNRDNPWWIIDIKPPIRLGKIDNGDLPRFLTNMHQLFPEDAILYAEAPYMCVCFESFLKHNKLETSVKTKISILHSDGFHIPLNRRNLAELADILDGHSASEVCELLVAYKGETVLMECSDVHNGIFEVSGEISEETVRNFCSLRGFSYRKSNAEQFK